MEDRTKTMDKEEKNMLSEQFTIIGLMMVTVYGGMKLLQSAGILTDRPRGKVEKVTLLG